MLLNDEGNLKEKLTVRITSTNANLSIPGLFYLKLLSPTSQREYEFHATEWKSADENRLQQSNISYNEDQNTLTATTNTGNFNLALSLDLTTAKDYVVIGKKYLVVKGKDIRLSTSDNVLWWLNGINKGSSIPATSVLLTADGEVVVLWDLSDNDLNANCKGEWWDFFTGMTCFGLTSTTGTSTISYVGFYDSDEVDNLEVIEDENIPSNLPLIYPQPILEADQQYNDARLLLYQYLREAIQQYNRDITSVIPAYNSGIVVYNDESSSISEINEAILSLQNAIADAVSLYQVGVPATYGILNQGFENLSAQEDRESNSGQNTPFGWDLTRNGTTITTGNGTWSWAAINSDGGSYMEGSHIWGIWNGSNYGDIELSQTLTDMPNGKWRLTALVMNRGNESQKLARIFLNNSSMLAGNETDYASLPEGEQCSFSGEWSTADNDMHQRFQVEADVTDGTIKFGLRSNCFFKVDDFKLTYLGPLDGDVNNDGAINISDVSAIISILLGKDNTPPYNYNHEAADVNHDNVITISDVSALINILLGR